jgi:hypothetical protein
MNVQIFDLLANDEAKIQQVATLLFQGFKQHWLNAWPDINTALQEIQASFGTDRIQASIFIQMFGNTLLKLEICAIIPTNSIRKWVLRSSE